MLQVGHPAPSFSLPDASMEMMHLSSFRGKLNVVLFFYPRDGTPGCTMQATDFSDLEQEFVKLDTIVFGVSRDDVLSHAAFRDAQGLSVQLLSDNDSVVCRKYDVLEKKVVDGRPRESLTRSTFIIDKKGILRHILRDVNPKDHADEVLEALKALNGRAN
ncbi:MAG: peroxiredoxin [Betaproteobacteria bacterium]|nr:peroxiredoxin [Betaproteobacteria bacterium]